MRTTRQATPMATVRAAMDNVRMVRLRRGVLTRVQAHQATSSSNKGSRSVKGALNAVNQCVCRLRCMRGPSCLNEQNKQSQTQWAPWMRTCRITKTLSLSTLWETKQGSNRIRFQEHNTNYRQLSHRGGTCHAWRYWRKKIIRRNHSWWTCLRPPSKTPCNRRKQLLGKNNTSMCRADIKGIHHRGDLNLPIAWWQSRWMSRL